MREKLIELLRKDGCPDNGCDFCQYAESEHCRAEVIADRLIANDVVPVVRCKDCKHYDKDALWCNINSPMFSEEHYNWYEDDFCSIGERRTDG